MAVYATPILASEANSKVIVPPGIIPKGSAEYYSTSPNTPVLIPIQIWGEVAAPGTHYIAESSNLYQALSSAGGPLHSADIDPILLYRAGEHMKLDLREEGLRFAMRPGDTIVVDRSFKNDLPLVFGIVSSIVAVATLILVTSKE